MKQANIIYKEILRPAIPAIHLMGIILLQIPIRNARLVVLIAWNVHPALLVLYARKAVDSMFRVMEVAIVALLLAGTILAIINAYSVVRLTAKHVQQELENIAPYAIQVPQSM